jgi:flagellin
MSGFRVGTSLGGLAAMRHLDIVKDSQAKSIAKLSSGSRINRAADDAAGLAITERFRSQINGLFQGKLNIQDGVSLVQTAEGGVRGIQDMIQRLRTLAVQASNDTLTDSDRSLIQKEVDHLVTEIDRQASTANFNTRKLLDGSNTGIGSQTVTPAGPVVAQTFDSAGVVQANVRPNYYRVSLADPTAVAPGAGGEIEFVNSFYTSATIAGDADTLDVVTGIVGNNMTYRFQFQPGVVANDVTQIDFRFVGGSDANGVSPDNVVMQLYDFQATSWVTVGNNGGDILGAVADVTGTENTGDMSRYVDGSGDIWAQAYVQTDVAPAGSNTLRIDYTSLTVTTQTAAVTTNNPADGLFVHAGADANQTIELEMPDMRSSTLGLSGLSLSTRTAAENALTTLDTALARVTGHLAKLGADQNRLGASMNFNGIAHENMTAAKSRMKDLDFSEEIVNLSKNQIIEQSATAAVSQANLNSQAILQLLG